MQTHEHKEQACSVKQACDKSNNPNIKEQAGSVKHASKFQ
jgi:hypothetical protein